MALRTVILGRFPAKRLLENGRVIWEQPTVTIEAERNSAGNLSFIRESLNDPIGVFRRWEEFYAGIGKPYTQAVSFTAPVSCDREVKIRLGSFTEFQAGSALPALKEILPTGTGKHVFTPLED